MKARTPGRPEKKARVRRARISFFSRRLAVMALAMLLIGCKRDDMADQPKIRTLRESPQFADGASARPLVPGTIARGHLDSSAQRFAATQASALASAFPFEITAADLKRGRQRYAIYCSVCHGGTGDGDGMIVQRGFTQPPTFHSDRLRNIPVGHFVNVIQNGYGAMYSYADRVNGEDRWRIAAYIRALQFSRNVRLADLSESERVQLAGPATAPASQPSSEESGGGSFR